MINSKHTPDFPDIAEAVFDTAYLLFALIAGILFFIFSKGTALFILYGILTLTLCGGDTFHLVPRIIRAFKGSNENIRKQLCLGLQVSSITMTVFYVILLYIWENTFPDLAAPAVLKALIWISAVSRILICLLPRNNWYSVKENMTMSYIRNGVFCITGICIVILYLMSGNTYDYHLTRMSAAVLISFACYLPVVFFINKNPKLGMLMIPKTCAYIWMIVMGLQLLFK